MSFPDDSMPRKIISKSNEGGDAPDYRALPQTMAAEPITESIFGPEKSSEMIAKLLRRHGSDRVDAFLSFMKAEVEERMRVLPREDIGKWDDAPNMYSLLPTHGFVESGRDMDFMREDLEHCRIRGYDNLSQRETLSRLYVQVRRRIFPEAPDGENTLKSQPITESVFGEKKSEEFLTSLMVRHKGDRFLVLRDFMRQEIKERGKGLTAKGKERWGDAGNIYAPFLMMKEYLTSGRDAGLLIQSLEESMAKGEDNITERETLARVYTQVRRKLFPEIPEDKDFRLPT